MKIEPWMWVIWISVGFVMEMVAVFNHVDNDTLTATIVTYVPAIWIGLATAWVVAHFAEAIKHKGHERAPRKDET